MQPGFLSLPRGPTRRSRGRGVALWPVSPSLVRPRPSARALGASEERARARRAGRFAGNFGPWLSCPVRHGCPVRPFAKSGLSQVLAFWTAGGRGLVAPSGGLSVCATRFFRLRLLRWFVQPAGVPTWRGASRGSPAAPCGLQVNRVARTVQPA